MAQANQQGIKRYLLIAYVALSVVLIGLILINGLLPPEEKRPAFYRATSVADGAPVSATLSPQATLQPSDTPTPGQSATPVPTIIIQD